MVDYGSLIAGFAAALGSGLLIGAERERRKDQAGSRPTAGIRTFAVASVAGAIAIFLGGRGLLIAMIMCVAILAATAYWRNREEDPGITTEIALVATTLLGGLSIDEPALAAGLAVTLAVVLAARTPLHEFVRHVLRPVEVRDSLIFAGATLVILPVLPNRALGPYQALNPHIIGILVILVMAVGAAGHIAVRVAGPRIGLPLAGFVSGFISSTATIAAYGTTAKTEPVVFRSAVAGATLSTVATILQMSGLIATISVPTFQHLFLPLAFAGGAAVLYGGAFMALALSQAGNQKAREGRVFSLATALAYGVTLSVIMLFCAFLRDRFGEAGLTVATALAGLVDAHAPALTVAALVGSGKITVADATLPILVGLSTNTVSKIAVAIVNGGRLFSLAVVPGLILVTATAFIVAWRSGFSG